MLLPPLLLTSTAIDVGVVVPAVAWKFAVVGDSVIVAATGDPFRRSAASNMTTSNAVTFRSISKPTVRAGDVARDASGAANSSQRKQLLPAPLQLPPVKKLKGAPSQSVDGTTLPEPVTTVAWSGKSTSPVVPGGATGTSGVISVTPLS